MIYKKILIKVVCTLIMILGASWWSFAQRDSITIEMALDIAEENNPSLRTSKLNLERSQLNLLAQKLALKSRFTLNLEPASYSRERRFENRLSEWYENETFSTGGTFRVSQPILLTDGTITLTDNFSWQNNTSFTEGNTRQNKAFNNNLRLTLDQPIFTYNTRKMALKDLEFRYENAGISYALQRLRTEASISDQFYRVYMAQNTLEIRKEEFENEKKNYEIIKSKVDASLLPRAELFQAEVNFLSAQSAVEDQIASLENAKDNLKLALGIPLNENINVKADIEFTTVPVNFNQAVESGMASRMELRQREIEIEQADMDMVQTKAQNEFRGNISLSLGITGVDERFSNMYNNPTQNPRVAVSFSVPIFDWGEKKARVKAQETTQTIAKLNAENQINEIELNVRQVFREIERIHTQIGIEEKNLQNAQRTYDLNVIKYREGELTGMQMSQYQTQLSTRKISYSQTLINYKIALLNLKIASLYDFENDKPVIPVMGLEN